MMNPRFGLVTIFVGIALVVLESILGGATGFWEIMGVFEVLFFTDYVIFGFALTLTV